MGAGRGAVDGVVADTAGVPVSDATLETLLVAMLDARRPGATMCPSEVARAATPVEAEWRALMPRVRAVAAVLAADGRLVAARGGAVVDATSAGGPIRLARVDPGRSPSPDGGATPPEGPRTRGETRG